MAEPSRWQEEETRGSEVDEEELGGIPYKLLAELLLDPSLISEPKSILPRFAWPQRSTLLAAGVKDGKSTVVRQGAAAMVTGQEFLGAVPEQGSVLWYALDEPLGDVVRGFSQYGARHNIVVCDQQPDASLKDMEIVIQEFGVSLVVFDTLTELVAGRVKDPYSPTEWTPVLRQLRGVLKRTGAGCILIHHTKKSGGYADSRQIGAGVDVIIEMTTPANDPSVRKLACRGRVPVSDFAIRYFAPWYNLDGGELPLELRVYRAIEAQPGMGAAKVRAAVGGNAKEVDRAVSDLLYRGGIEDRGTGKSHEYHACSGQAFRQGGLL